MAYTKYSLTPANNTATPPDGAPEGMLPSAVNDTMRDMMAQIRDCGDGIRDGTYTMTAPKITGGTITGVAFTGNTFTSPVISGGSINNTPIGATTANTGAFTTLSATGVTTVQAGTVSLPAITTSGDTNTGIFFPAADTIAFTEGGTESMRIDSSGNVGINTTSPGVKLGVVDTSAGSATFPAIFGNRGTTVGTQVNIGLQTYDSGSSGITNVIGSVTTSATGGAGSADMVFQTTGSGTRAERMRITSAGNVGIGTTSPGAKLQVTTGGSNSPGSNLSGNIGQFTSSGGIAYVTMGNGDSANQHRYVGAASAIQVFGKVTDAGSATEQMRITSDGTLLIGKTTDDQGTGGAALYSDGSIYSAKDVAANLSTVFLANRITSDGDLFRFLQAGTQEGSISVSGTTVSYNGGHLSRWSQLPSNQKDDTLLKGTVMSNLDDMCVWVKDGEVLPNEQLNKMKVSDVEGDTNVAGVFVNWTFDEQCQSDDMNVAMTGDMIIRIAQGVVVEKGDLLMSAGDGTAKPQGDDIRRSKTVAKVTSNHVTCTYADGSYCVPCVLMAC